MLAGGDYPVLYQVPLTWRTRPLAGAERALIGSVRDDQKNERFVYDGPHDPAYAAALLELVLDRTAGFDEAGVAARGALIGTDPRSQPVSSRVLSGEQSNTSIIYELAGSDGGQAAPVILKLFRSLHGGDNPDVAVQLALGSVGFDRVPRLIGAAIGEWPDPREPSGRARGHLAFAQEFLPEVHDAWRVALAAATAGEDFSDPARSLGQTTALMHAALAEAMPTITATPTLIARAVGAMRDRLATAVREVPEVAAFQDAIERVLVTASRAPWPRLQRIHGDLHLGQVLSVPGRGWLLLDFEGEPLRSVRERSQPDATLRDVAGMLRSFSYAAGHAELANPGIATNARAWAQASRRAFLDGYCAAAQSDTARDAAILAAFELDKAVYEAIYESRNRPEWLSIPLQAIRLLTS